MPRPSRRDDIIKTAIDLFGQRGFHNTGVDLIMVEAKVSKKTLYTYFRSKEELILAVLQHHDGLFRNAFMKQVDKLATKPDQRLLAIFDVAQGWFMQDNFFGCMFINVIGEYSESDTAIRKVAQYFKAQMHSFIKENCVKASAKDPDALASELALLLEGAIVTAQISKNPAAAVTAKNAARSILKEHLPSNP